MWGSVRNPLQGLWKRLYRRDGKDLWNRLKEHDSIKKALLTAVGEHFKDTGHSLDKLPITNFTREDETLRGKIKEAFELECQSPALKRDSGYQLPAIYRDILSLTTSWIARNMGTNRVLIFGTRVLVPVYVGLPCGPQSVTSRGESHVILWRDSHHLVNR